MGVCEKLDVVAVKERFICSQVTKCDILWWSSPPSSQACRWLWRWFVQALGEVIPKPNAFQFGAKGPKILKTIICEGPQNQGSQLNTVYSTGCRKICLWGACRLCLPGSNIIYKDFKTLSSRSCFLSCDLVKIPYFEIQETTLRNTLNFILKMFFFFIQNLIFFQCANRRILVLTIVFVQKQFLLYQWPKIFRNHFSL